MKQKTAEATAQAFEKVITESGIVPKLLLTDFGKEFEGGAFQRMLQKNNIKHYHTSTNMKAAHAEIAIKTIFGRMARVWHLTKSKAWVPWLNQIVASYNSTIHSAHNYAPKDINETNSHIVWRNLYHKLISSKPKPPKYAVGDRVRISSKKILFSKGYEKRWSEIVYTISKVILTKPVVYELQGIVNSRFYTDELNLVEKA
jgi:hypothetical protein